MKLIEFDGIEIDRKNIYKEEKRAKTNWLGYEVGYEIIKLPEILEVKIFKKHYVVPIDKIIKLEEIETQTSHKWLINDWAVEKETFEKVKQELKEYEPK